MKAERRPRVLVLSFNWPPTTYAFRTLEAVAEEGIDVAVGLTLRPDQPLPTHETLELFRIAPWRQPWPSRLSSGLGTTVASLRRGVNPIGVARTVRRDSISNPRQTTRALFDVLPMLGRRPDVVHHEWANGPANQPWRLWVFDAPSIVSCRGLQTTVDPYDPRHLDYGPRLARALHAADRVHCVSEYMASEAVALGARPEALSVIHPAVDLAAFTRRPTVPLHDPVRLLAVARLRWVKGFEHLLLAVAELRRRDRRVVLDVIGKGPLEQARLEAAIDDLGLGDAVSLRGAADVDGVVAALHAADILVQPSLTEGMANAAIEAMAVGVPVVASDAGGMSELIQDGVEGLLVPRRDPRSVAGAVERLIDDEELRRNVVEAAYDRVSADFRIEHQAAEWAELYRTVASSVARPDTVSPPWAPPRARSALVPRG